MTQVTRSTGLLGANLKRIGKAVFVLLVALTTAWPLAVPLQDELARLVLNLCGEPASPVSEDEEGGGEIGAKVAAVVDISRSSRRKPQRASSPTFQLSMVHTDHSLISVCVP